MGKGGLDPPGKSQVAIGFLRNSGRDPLKKQVDPRVQLLHEGGPYGPLKSIVDLKKTLS